MLPKKKYVSKRSEEGEKGERVSNTAYSSNNNNKTNQATLFQQFNSVQITPPTTTTKQTKQHNPQTDGPRAGGVRACVAAIQSESSFSQPQDSSDGPAGPRPRPSMPSRHASSAPNCDAAPGNLGTLLRKRPSRPTPGSQPPPLLPHSPAPAAEKAALARADPSLSHCVPDLRVMHAHITLHCHDLRGETLPLGP